ncbi:MAG: bifunctional phosphoribosylaminoimidazolecarboxamide formyltransferase/IMP cyclohydrolase [Planctomycetota bacterium]
MQRRIERALIAVSDKEGIVELAARLEALGVEILSTGGTARTLREGGVTLREVQDVTGFPEMMGGRVKTLHPRIHGGILARRDEPEDQSDLAEHNIPAIDLVVVNLYPFERRVAEGISARDAIEEIDIGGPALIRAAAKNHEHVAVVVDPGRYPSLLEELERGPGSLGAGTRRSLAEEAFQRTAAYEAAIANWFGEEREGAFPSVWTEQWRKVEELRYGENPHQAAAWYRRADGDSVALPEMRFLGGKDLSYNNLLDTAAAVECAAALQGPAAVIVKHCLPCGAAERAEIDSAFEAALEGDPLSAFGGILALTEPLSAELAGRIATAGLFFEVMHAPRFLPGAEDAIREGARWGKSCRLLEGGRVDGRGIPRQVRSVPGALLMQEGDRPAVEREELKVVSSRPPTEQEWLDLLFAWRVVPFVRSNAILLAREWAVTGVGAGQPSRVDAVAIACRKAGERAAGSVLASDAFFPFSDGIEAATAAGVTAAIQPGGSVRDRAVIEAADRAGMALLHTGERHFRH